MKTAPKDSESKASQYYKVYEEYSKALRTWLVTYGIGAPALFVTNETAAKALKAAPDAKSIALLFFFGVAIQILLASSNKVAMWALYYGETNRSFKRTKKYWVADWISEQFWIDVLVDFAAMVLFAIATWRVFLIVGGP